MPLSLNMNIIGNAILFQVLWFASVLGAAHQHNWPSLAALAALMAWSIFIGKQIQADLRMAFIGLLIAFTVEPVWIGLERVDYQLQPSASYPPLWIICLWVGFSLCFNHCLRWLKERYFLALWLGLLGAPLSLYSAHGLGALEAPEGWSAILILYCPAWAALTPALAWLSGSRPSDELQRDDVT
ncbi:DUF2878 domain-containing protein [Hahella ganghwensis]|uniref:DUF2878 domain-containing protein n=1 Tax=Hahella ganghwensis TaxID=286420 RepID=UPI00037C1265|nr:DUF2878 domain-containing protein [Hahella ganghwensis]